MIRLLAVMGWMLVSSSVVEAQRPLDTRLPTPSVAAYKNVFELIRLLNGLSQLNQDEALRFTPEQATAMLVVLGPLESENNLTPELAAQTTTSLLLLLNTEQRVWWEELKKTQARFFQKRAAQMRTLESFTVYHVVVPGYPKLRNLIERGETLNPFQVSPNLETFTGLLKALRDIQ
jgi:hypothetical protein